MWSMLPDNNATFLANRTIVLAVVQFISNLSYTLTYRNRKYNIFVSGKICNMAVERNSFLCCSSLTDGE